MFEDNIIPKFFEVLNKHDLKKMEDLLESNAEFYFPKTEPLIGKERILKFLKILFRQYPELSFQIEKVIVQGE